MARYFDVDKGAVAIEGLSRALFLSDDMVLPGWPERMRMAVQLLAGFALLLGLGLYDVFYDAALLAGGLATVCLVTYLLQRSLVPLLLAGKLRQLERATGRCIRLMSDGELASIVARGRRKKKRSRR